MPSARPSLCVPPGAGGEGLQDIGAWVSRAQGLFSSAEHALGQDLPGQLQGIGRPVWRLSRACTALHGSLATALPPASAKQPPAPALPIPFPLFRTAAATLPAGPDGSLSPLGTPVHPRPSSAPSPLPAADSARQREQAAALQAALEHSSAEVRDLLSALDLAADAGSCGAGQQGDGAQRGGANAAADAAVLVVRGALAEAHERVQDAAARLRQAAGEVEGLKRQHLAMRQQVGAPGQSCCLLGCRHGA